MISICFLFLKIPLPRGGSYPSIVIPTGAKYRVQSPLERWPCTISTDRPEMESRPYEFLLHNVCTMRKDAESKQDLAKDNPETNPINIKPEAVSQVAEQFS